MNVLILRTTRDDKASNNQADVIFNVEMTSDSLTKPGTKGEPTRIVGDAPDHRAAPDDARDHPVPDDHAPRDVNK